MNRPTIPLLDVVQENAPLREELLEALTRVVDSGRFLHGEDVRALEEEIAQVAGARHAVSCASGSDALLLSLMALGIGPGDEVIVPSFTFFATASCVARLGARIVFADIDPTTLQIDPASVARLLSPRTRAVIPVHLFGRPAPVDELQRSIGERSIAVIEDAAQSIGAVHGGRPVGGIGAVGCFSFYPTKNLGGMGDGGMLTTSDESLAERLRLLAAHGMKPRYYHSVVGINSRLDSFQAAVLRVKLHHLASWNEARRERAERYLAWFAEAGAGESIVLPQADAPGDLSVWNQFTIRVPGGRRGALKAHLAEQGIGSEVYYPVPLHCQECFRDADVVVPALPATEAAAGEVLSLPVSPCLTESDQRRVVDTVVEFARGTASPPAEAGDYRERRAG